jgi:hypothetical protein
MPYDGQPDRCIIKSTEGDLMNRTSRTTRECSIEDLDPALRTAMREHIAKYKLGDIESDILVCCETTSVRHRKGLFSRAQNTRSAAFVTPKWLVWADSTKRNDAGAGSAQLAQIEVHDFGTTAMGVIAPDEGLNITGRYTNENKTGMTFIVLGAGPDGQKFRKLLHDAMEKAGSQ